MKTGEGERARMFIPMLPLACAEIARAKPHFLVQLFDGRFMAVPNTVLVDALTQMVLAGGFPGTNDVANAPEVSH